MNTASKALADFNSLDAAAAAGLIPAQSANVVAYRESVRQAQDIGPQLEEGVFVSQFGALSFAHRNGCSAWYIGPLGEIYIMAAPKLMPPFFESVQEIKDAVDTGKTVYWQSKIYMVVNGGKAGYLIKCLANDHCIGLTWTDGTTLNGKLEDFYQLD
jgi:hypothetical protein